MNDIDFEQFTSPSAISISGRDKGIAAREKLDLKTKDADDSEYRIIVPEYIISLHISFLLGLFGDSIRKLGKEDFLKKYQYQDYEKYKTNIDESVTRALMTSDVLRK